MQVLLAPGLRPQVTDCRVLPGLPPAAAWKPQPCPLLSPSEQCIGATVSLPPC